MVFASKWVQARFRLVKIRTPAKLMVRRGHLSGTVGPEQAVLMLVQLEVLPTIAKSCRFR